MTLQEIAEYASAQADAAHLRRIEGAGLRDDEYWQPVLDIIRAELFIIIRRETMTPAETARRFVRDYCRPPSKDAEDNAIAALTKLLEGATAMTDKPIDMILYCPKCGDLHIDEPDGEWTNPPHRSHLCHSCKCIWRPADVPTNGVLEIKTKGKADTWEGCNDHD